MCACACAGCATAMCAQNDRVTCAPSFKDHTTHPLSSFGVSLRGSNRFLRSALHLGSAREVHDTRPLRLGRHTTQRCTPTLVVSGLATLFVLFRAPACPPTVQPPTPTHATVCANADFSITRAAVWLPSPHPLAIVCTTPAACECTQDRTRTRHDSRLRPWAGGHPPPLTPRTRASLSAPCVTPRAVLLCGTASAATARGACRHLYGVVCQHCVCVVSIKQPLLLSAGHLLR